MDVSNLTSLVTALRAETAYASITPESLGALLQKVVDAIGQTSSDDEFRLIKSWSEAIKRAVVLTNISQDSADRNNVLLNTKSVALATGAESNSANAIIIKQATTERAGAMRAQQVIDLNTAKSNISSLTSNLSTLSRAVEDLVSGVKIDHYSAYSFSSSWNTVGNPSTNLYLHVFFKNNTCSSSVIPYSAANAPSTNAYNIVCDCQPQEMRIANASVLSDMGYVPYIFRYTLKRNRLRDKETQLKYRGPKRRGWHLFYDADLARVRDGSIIVFDYITGNKHTGFYSSTPANLIGVTISEDDDGNITHIKVGFGKKTIDAVKGRRFKFGIAFGPSMTSQNFNFANLVTNIATFHVHVRVSKASGKCEIDFCL